MRVVNFSEARSGLKSVIYQVIADADCTVITRRNAPDAVLMSIDTFNSLLETVHLLKSPANAAHLARSIERCRKGQVQPRDLVDLGQRKAIQGHLDLGSRGRLQLLAEAGRKDTQANQCLD
jgi:antitoxin YefM